MLKGIYIRTAEHRKHLSEVRIGEKNYRWQEKPSYGALHKWLNKTFGKANHCENCGSMRIVGGKKTTYDWAVLKDKKYERKRENFWRLCRSCHNIYDNRIQNIKKMRDLILI